MISCSAELLELDPSAPFRSNLVVWVKSTKNPRGKIGRMGVTHTAAADILSGAAA
jgi:hypothetical protein